MKKLSILAIISPLALILFTPCFATSQSLPEFDTEGFCRSMPARNGNPDHLLIEICRQTEKTARSYILSHIQSIPPQVMQFCSQYNQSEQSYAKLKTCVQSKKIEDTIPKLTTDQKADLQIVKDYLNEAGEKVGAKSYCGYNSLYPNEIDCCTMYPLSVSMIAANRSPGRLLHQIERDIVTIAYDLMGKTETDYKITALTSDKQPICIFHYNHKYDVMTPILTVDY